MEGTVETFPGTDIPIARLIDHLERGEPLETFQPTLPPASLERTLVAALTALTSTGRRPRQASLLPQTDGKGVILNAEELTADQVVGRSVQCPGCAELVFRSWPEGWDGHAAHRCSGIAAGTEGKRKTEFKKRFGHLFKS